MAAQKVSGSKQASKLIRRRRSAKPATRDTEPVAQNSDPAVLGQIIADPGLASPEAVLGLQRTHGNRALHRLIQAKLAVGPVGDEYEQEADQVAQQVAGKGTQPGQPSVQREAPPEEEELQKEPLVQREAAPEEEELQMKPEGPGLVQREAAPEEEELQMKPLAQRSADGSFEAGSDLERRLGARQGSGASLPDEVRAFMEPRFGSDFSDVQVHTDSDSIRMNEELGAQAFTHGSDIYFGVGKYDPGSSAGKQLLAHELTHVVQQTGASQIQREVKHTTGKQVDTYLDASPFVKKFVEEKVKKGVKAEGHVHIHTPEDFLKEWIKYATARTNPDTGALFTEDEAKAWEPSVNAYQGDGEIHIHQDRGETGTAIHESMHLFSDEGFASKVGFNANEGSTEYFTRMICEEQKITRGDFYVDQRKSVEKLVGASSKEKLAGAYYQGKVADLETAVDAKGKDTFKNWLTFMKTGKYSDADGLL